ncbi:MAG TPA: xanthine dehydrogenase family protein molybdopterin-binding subunit, partial [Myxococcales bacterium]|nr:xanthine dehydrogenase family protein molybdopterin-binding subunit [Myxococcales bacterium]
MSSEPDSLSVVHHPAPRVDAVDKVRGFTRYVDDFDFPGLLYCKVVTSAHAHAEVLAIDVSEAAASDGVFAAITARDIPGENQIGVATADQPLLVESKARMLADRVALVAADTLEHAREAARKVKVQYRPLPVVADVDVALAADAPAIHERGNTCARKQVIKGDMDAGWARA